MLVKPRDYIGKITTARVPYYDLKSNRMKMKKRPVLVIGIEKNSFPCDFNVLPVSTITKRENIHVEYDFKIEKNKCKLMNLNSSPSFIRIHKQHTCYSKNINKNILCDLLKDHTDIYEKIKTKFNEFNETLF